ncbi:hypothetical protein N7488_001413 [Penicillium malachiteum]|nr:hypothetical protein N7488_001413 [Penicillium malachiteum]
MQVVAQPAAHLRRWCLASVTVAGFARLRTIGTESYRGSSYDRGGFRENLRTIGIVGFGVSLDRHDDATQDTHIHPSRRHDRLITIHSPTWSSTLAASARCLYILPLNVLGASKRVVLSLSALLIDFFRGITGRE